VAAILIGNGFSRAFDNTRFDYAALFNAAGFTGRVVEIFDTVDTRDFETVLRRLDQFIELLAPYGINGGIAAAARDDRETVRTSLIDALRVHHPERSTDLPAHEAQHCAAFLQRFQWIFTVNYDLLLYWVIARHLRGEVVADDGFRGVGAPVWQGEGATPQRVFNLHGGLHLWEERSTLRKLAFEPARTLISQLTENLQVGRYPLFVSEGTSAQKRARIWNNEYLSSAYAALRQNVQPLTVYGMSLGEPDQHIVDAISSSLTPELTITHRDGADDDEIDRLNGIGRAITARLRTKVGRTVPLTLAPASAVFAWR
jgi:Domain of unknown function (DUF4917)